ncbi:hypothetical protein [Streptomyces canus]|nr:hypothetical protein [Streptomyces canus]
MSSTGPATLPPLVRATAGQDDGSGGSRRAPQIARHPQLAA